ncbi:glycerate kinase, partial [Candidatus Latescibacterota bacterium]
ADPYYCIMKTFSVTETAIVIGDTVYDRVAYPKVMVIGGGKASARMGQALEEILGDRINGGWINTKDGHSLPLNYITVHECSHPVPDERGVEGTRKIIDILEQADKQTLVICVLSGGGSALMPAPAEGISLAEKQEVTKLLLAAGADIVEINTIRKHMSLIKGGGMARYAFPAALHMLILSDVIGDPLDSIASGPAVADPGTFADCIEICMRYSILDKLPENVRSRFENGAAGKIPDTPKSGDKFLETAVNMLIGNNRMSVTAAEETAKKHGFNTLVLSSYFQGEAAQLGNFFSAIAFEIEKTGDPIPAPACIIGGGETTVTIRGTGMGGRNQEMALAAAMWLDGKKNVAFLSGGTDGTDGPTDAAGGVVDGDTVARLTEKGLSAEAYIANNDSYNCLKAVNGLIMTGPTGTNVMDIQILLVGE